MGTYNNYIERLSNKVLSRLSDIEAVFNFDFGQEFEVAMCRLLEDILPGKYGICRGFVVTESGDTAGDDLIIFDKMACPSLRATAGLQYAVKEQIPVDAVYAYLECKHTLTAESVEKAFGQVRNVKKLLLTRPAKNNEAYESDGPVFGKKAKDWPRVYPRRKNQPYCAIISRQHEVGLPNNMSLDELTPDLVILGKDSIATQSEILGPDGIKASFFFDEKCNAPLRVEHVPEIAFGIGLVSLMHALSWIELLPIDWAHSLNTAYWRDNKTD